jgi:hypothetical protein
MIARDLNEIDRQIAEVRQQIEEQRGIIQRFEQEHQTADATQAGVLLKVLEDDLSLLLQRRIATLSRARRPRAKSSPGHAIDPHRRSRGSRL